MWRILVADDNLSNRKLIIEILEGKALCDTATNGQETLDAYNLSLKECRPYNLILLDIKMPDMDGIEVLKEIREHEKNTGVKVGKEIPIIMVTAHRESFSDAFKVGCDDYIIKPIRPNMLIEKIEKLLESK